MEDIDTRDVFLLDLLPSMSKPSRSQSSMSEHSQIPEPTSLNPRSLPSKKQVPISTRPTLVYSRKNTTIIVSVR